jgi:hypothetical protein
MERRRVNTGWALVSLAAAVLLVLAVLEAVQD